MADLNKIDIPFSPEEEEHGTAVQVPPNTPNIRDDSTTIGAEGARNRDAEYTDLLQQYINEYKQKNKTMKWMKNVFYWFIIGLFIALFVGSLVIVAIIFHRGMNNNVADIVLVCTSLFTLISSIIVLPLTIIKHLFPENQDSQIVQIVQSMINNDCEIRKVDNGKEH